MIAIRLHATLRLCIAVLVLLASGGIARARITELPGLIRQPMMLHVSFPDGSSATLEALLTRPDRPGRFPLAVINHGVPRDAMALVSETPENYSGPAIVFAQHGYAAVVVERRGFGRSSSPLNTEYEPCDDRNYPRLAGVWSQDVLAAVAALRQQSWAEPGHVLLVGHSAGGVAALAAATAHPAGVVGIVDFAGGAGSQQPDFVCQPERLVQTMHDFGQLVHVPSLWMFADNDHFFGPRLARQMFDAFFASGAPAAFDAAPAYGRDGHTLIFAASPPLWWPRVAEFLATLDLPTRKVVELPPPAALPVPPGLDDWGVRDFESYVGSRSYEKAFVTDGKGHCGRVFGRRSQEDAVAAAMAHCRQHDWHCLPYAIGNRSINP